MTAGCSQRINKSSPSQYRSTDILLAASSSSGQFFLQDGSYQRYVSGISDAICTDSRLGGVNNQTLDEAGAEANLDTQFAFGISFPTPATFFSTGGSPPFIPDSGTPTDTNEPYTAVS